MNNNNAQEVKYSDETISEILNRAERKLSSLNFSEEDREEPLQDLKQILIINNEEFSHLSPEEKKYEIQDMKQWENRGISQADMLMNSHFPEKYSVGEVAGYLRSGMFQSYFGWATRLSQRYLKRFEREFTQKPVGKGIEPSSEMRKEAEVLKKKLYNLRKKFPNTDKYFRPGELGQALLDCEFILTEGKTTSLNIQYKINLLRGDPPGIMI